MPPMLQFSVIPQLPFMPFGGGPGSVAGSDYGHMPPLMPPLDFQNTGSAYSMMPMIHRDTTRDPWPQVAPSTAQPAGSDENSTACPKLVKGPAIPAWLRYCDNHPDHGGENLATLMSNFSDQGYWMIDQLTSGHMSINNLLSWIKIGKGTADYIIQYANEDMALVNSDEFVMAELPNVDRSGDD